MDLIWGLDQQIFRAIHHGWHAPWLDPIFFVISSTGLGFVQCLLILSPWVYLLLRSQRDLAKRTFKAWTLPLLLAYGLSGLLNTVLLKKLIERERPSMMPDTIAQEGFKYNSFPSGHTATAFALACAIYFRLESKARRSWGWLLWVWAILVGLSRIYRGVHWPTDVVGGACVGLFSALLLLLATNQMTLGTAKQNEHDKDSAATRSATS